jgi:hypothetical protein
MLGRSILALAGFGIAGAAFHYLPVEGRASSSAPVVARGESLVSNDDRVFLPATRQAASRDAVDGDPIKSLLKVDHRMGYGDYVWRDKGIPVGPVWVRVDLTSQLMSVFRAGHEIGTSVILYGATQKETPTGVFPILAKLKDHQSSTYDAQMPYTLRLTGDGVSIHGSDVRWGAATHGCIGVPVEFAHLLFDQVSKGSRVVILSGSTSKTAKVAGQLKNTV